MSIKRTRQKSYRPSDKGEPGSSFDKGEPEKSWEEQTGGRADADFAPYDMKAKFAKGQLLSHAKFGKGIVLAVEGSRIVVLFAEGKKGLGHGLA